MSFRQKIESGEFVALGEFDPPKGADFSTMLDQAIKVKGRLDAIVIPEMARSVLKASSLGGSAFLQLNGIETILQTCCRDRNRLALQADILAANALGVSNIMVIQGDDIRFGDHPQAREVNDLNTIELLQSIETLQSGKDMSGIETILQTCCRDRNRLALQADILAANALGVSNIMVIQGDDIRFGDHPQAREVNDLNTIELLQSIETLQSGKDMSGIELSGAPEFFAGSVLNAGVSGGLMDMEMENLNKMIEVGARFVITTPVFDIHWFQQLLKRIDLRRIAVIPTVLLLKSAGMARYIDRNVKNITIPSEMIRDIQKSPDKPKACIQIAAELINHLKDMGVAGVMISTMGWEDRLPQLLDAAKL